jgi:uncharacterized membrane protein
MFHEYKSRGHDTYKKRKQQLKAKPCVCTSLTRTSREDVTVVFVVVLVVVHLVPVVLDILLLLLVMLVVVVVAVVIVAVVAESFFVPQVVHRIVYIEITTKVIINYKPGQREDFGTCGHCSMIQALLFVGCPWRCLV